MRDRFVQNIEMAQETGVGVVSCCQGDLERERNLWGKRERMGRGREKILILMNMLGHDWRHAGPPDSCYLPVSPI